MIMSSYSQQIEEWAQKCFGPNTDKKQRVFRFLEEANELAQSLGCSKEDAHELVEYTWNRPVGIPHQEVGGTMVTLAMLCNYHGMSLEDGAVDELNRINKPEVIEKIRAKNATKPRFSPLPGVSNGDAN